MDLGNTQNPIVIGDGLFPVRVAGQDFAIDLIEVNRTINDINAKHAGAKNFEHLDDFIAYMKATYVMELRRSQADALWEELTLQLLRQKKGFADAVRSLNSTDSTPEPETQHAE